MYSIASYKRLEDPDLRRVFDALRKEVLALDPCVTEGFLKTFVRYWAESSFLDVRPKRKRLRMTLNLTFPEVTDPRGRCRDVTGLGHWGHGGLFWHW